jgi:RNA polymerase sigma-70 factor (ECF subfamily)
MSSELFEQLAMPLFDSLYNHARWLTGNRTEAEDLVQETYTRALRGLETFGEGTSLRAWMHRMLRNTFLTSRSRLVERNTSSLGGEDVEIESMMPYRLTPETAFLQEDLEQEVTDGLATLPTAFREIILLCEIEELSYLKIAEVLSVPMGTGMSRLSRARNLLRQALRRTPGKSQHAA